MAPRHQNHILHGTQYASWLGNLSTSWYHMEYYQEIRLFLMYELKRKGSLSALMQKKKGLFKIVFLAEEHMLIF